MNFFQFDEGCWTVLTFGVFAFSALEVYFYCFCTFNYSISYCPSSNL